MTIILVSFLAGLLSVLAPCVLPMIPIMFGGGLVGDKRKPLRIITSAMVCIFVFTYLFKISTSFVNIDPSTWTLISGTIIGLYGLVLVFPNMRDGIVAGFRSLRRSDSRNDVITDSQNGIRGDILLGASLGPIFATCSPTYALLLGSVLPVSIGLAVSGILAYMIGFGGFLYILVLGGRQIIKKFYGLSNSNGWFKKILGGILFILGIFIITGYIKTIEANLISCISDSSAMEQSLLEKWGINKRLESNTTDVIIEEDVESLDVGE